MRGSIRRGAGDLSQRSHRRRQCGEVPVSQSRAMRTGRSHPSFPAKCQPRVCLQMPGVARIVSSCFRPVPSRSEHRPCSLASFGIRRGSTTSRVSTRRFHASALVLHEFGPSLLRNMSAEVCLRYRLMTLLVRPFRFASRCDQVSLTFECAQ